VGETSTYKFGGAFGILSAAASLVATILIFLVGAPPADAEDLLRYLSPATAPWSIIASLSVLAALLLLPFAHSMYRATRESGANLALAGAGLLTVFAILDMAVRWTSYGALITLAEPWSGATTTEIETLILSAGHATAVLQSFLTSVYVTLIPGIGIMLVSVAWNRSGLMPIVAYAGIAVGVLAIAAMLAGLYISSLGSLTMVTSVAMALWFGLAGYALLRLERSSDGIEQQ
jgi:hypothetical protein